MKIEFCELSLSDKNLFKSFYEIDKPETSDVSFTNLFMWRKYYRFKYAVSKGFLIIFSEPLNDEPFAFFPIGNGDLEEILNDINSYFISIGKNPIYKKVSANQLNKLKKINNFNFKETYDRDNCDYLYLSQDLISLKGKKFHSKRNHINKFLSLYEYEYVKYTETHLEACLKIMDKWCEGRDCSKHSKYYCEKLANKELLFNTDKLDVIGALIKVNGIFCGFTFGEELNDNTAVIHIEKADTEIHGIYAFINQKFCENELSKYTYINREQDLGIEGIRKAKLSYNPVKLVDKYTIIMD